MLAYAFLAVAAAAERDTQPTPTDLITLTVNEFRRLFDALLLAGNAPSPACCTGPTGADNTNTGPAKPLPTTPTPIDHDLRL
jgi:hypothetical protein